MSYLKPSFFLLGPSKTGTTSLFFSLKEHPQLAAPFKKEMLFFAHRYNKGIDWYLSRFPEDDGTGKKTYESTPGYFAHWLTPHRMKCHGFEDAKFIIILRNPVDRFISHYKHFRSYNIIFEDPVDRPLYVVNQIKKDPSWTGEGRSFEEILTKKNSMYYKDGEYINYLKLWFDFFPKKQFLILDFRELKNNYSSVITQVEDFIGIDRVELPIEHLNAKEQWTRWRDVDTITEEQIKYLKNHYRPYNQALYNFLGRGFKWEEDKIIV